MRCCEHACAASFALRGLVLPLGLHSGSNVIPTAYLRVFQPLDAFERDEQQRWERFIAGLDRPAPVRPTYRDRETSSGLGLLAPVGADLAELRIVDGVTYVSPWRLRMRVLAAMLAFREAQPMELWDRIVPRREARKAARELRRIRRHSPRAVSFVHESPWHVPIRWFVLFRDQERRLDHDAQGRLRLRYRTPIRRAQRRAENAVPILRRSELGSISELIVELHQWMTQFDPRSMVELDYGGLAQVLGWDRLDDDHSARDVQDALDLLHKLEVPRSAEVYQGVLERWAGVRQLESFN